MHICTIRYHPVGFSYIAGGAHAECKDENGEVGECPELGGEDPSSTIQYYVDDVAVTDDESGFGLDACVLYRLYPHLRPSFPSWIPCSRLPPLYTHISY